GAPRGHDRVPTRRSSDLARPAQCLVCGGRHDMAMLHRVREKAPGDKAGGMRDVCHQKRSGAVGSFAEFLVVPVAAIGRCATNNEARKSTRLNSSHVKTSY